MIRNYKTEQREIIITFLCKNQGHHVTAGMIHEYIKEVGLSVGLATLYRYLDKLTENGVVLKYVVPGETSACYQYLGQPLMRSGYYFLVCVKCGKIIPLPRCYMESFLIRIQEEQHFDLDNSKTILYGYCENCENKRGDWLR